MAPTFRKAERMVSRKLIEALFQGGSSRSVAAFPLRAVYMKTERTQSTDAPVRLLVSVSKRRFRHAVDRNRVKRQLREAYRLHKQLLTGHVPPTEQLQVAFIWLADRHYPTDEVTRRVVSLLRRIAEKL